jgi:hypothetical protein
VKNQTLIEALQTMGLDPELEERIGGLVLQGYRVPVGRHAGDTVDVGFAIDFPCTPPGGVHIRGQWGALGQNGVSQSVLGADWQYWSRRYANWRSNRSPRSVLAYVNKILGDA